MRRLRHTIIMAALASVLGGCGGAKLVRHPTTPTAMAGLVQAADDRLAASIDWVIVRNGPGMWAKNSDWDEYMIRVRPLGVGAITITGVTLVDSLGNRLPADDNRSDLVRESKASVRRYKHSGLRVEAGMGGMGIAATGVGVSYGAASSMAAGSMAGGAYAGAFLFAVAAPAFGVAGIMRGVHNSQVNGEIGKRHTAFPQTIVAGVEQPMDLFFPLAPAPQRIEIDYMDGSSAHRLEIDTSAALTGLHLPARSTAAGAH